VSDVFLKNMGKITHMFTHTDGQRRDGETDDGMREFRGSFICPASRAASSFLYGPTQTWVLLLCASLSTSFLFRFFSVCVSPPPPPPLSLSLSHTQEDKRQKVLDNTQRPQMDLGAEEPKREL
jgi:hypothetical protein